MNPIADREMRNAFLGWQCRLRQIAMREGGGRPSRGMQPKVFFPSGEVVHPAMTVLIIPKEPEAATAYFRFQAQRTADPRKVYEAVLAYLQDDYFNRPESFGGVVAAVFTARSPTAERLVKSRKCLLEFVERSQTFRLSCRVRVLAAAAPQRMHALWHNRAFNPELGNDAIVLGFDPDWKTAQADPLCFR